MLKVGGNHNKEEKNNKQHHYKFLQFVNNITKFSSL